METQSAAIPTRDEEQSRIVANWLRRIEQSVGSDRRGLFIKALKQAGISHSNLTNVSQLRLDQLTGVIKSIQASIPDIILKSVTHLELLDLGLLGYAVASSGTLEKALLVMNSYVELTTDRFQQLLEIENDKAVIRPVPLLAHLSDYQDIAEDCIGGSWTLIKLLLNQDARSDRIEACFAYPPPPHAASYLELFGGRCRFEAERTALWFPASWLDCGITTSNMLVADSCTEMCKRILKSGTDSGDIVTRVQRLLLQHPGSSMLRLEEAARLLHLSPGQLRKRLYRLGTNYKHLVLDLRMTLARHYLQATHLSIQEITYLLDYTQPAPFFRAFKRYHGITPLQCRSSVQNFAP
ncbi:MAG: AraC family transcriptional regulator [Gammaproteobacteria bacterium]|nr:AraC family transcriptional regulator [Gammaproteobacteria bacterium]